MGSFPTMVTYVNCYREWYNIISYTEDKQIQHKNKNKMKENNRG